MVITCHGGFFIVVELKVPIQCIFFSSQEIFLYNSFPEKIARHLVFYEMRRNLNSDASNLNLVARSFYEMPTRFFALHSMVFRLAE